MSFPTIGHPLPVRNLTTQVTPIESFAFAHGGFSSIWRATLVDSGASVNMLVAVKVPKASFGSNATRVHKRETIVWSSLDHPHIAPLLGISYDFYFRGMACLVTPYYVNGNIMDYIGRVQGVNRLKLITQVTLGLSYLHSLSIVHGDLKGSNILIDDNGEARLSDYGLSRIIGTSGFTTKYQLGTFRYMAIELFAEGPEGSVPRITFESDIWAFGMTILEILTERVPFSYINNYACVIYCVMSGHLPERQRHLQIGDEVWAVMEACWDSEPSRRPSVATLCSFFQSQAIGIGAVY